MFILLILFLVGCKAPDALPAITNTSIPASETITTAIPLIMPTGTPEMENTGDCQTIFERRELKQPYQTSQGKMRYTLSDQELNAYLAVMGIDSVCIPESLGAPFINVDWDEAQNPATRGRMLSLGFENLYQGAGWSDGFLLYATYKFSTGSEYDMGASLKL